MKGKLVSVALHLRWLDESEKVKKLVAETISEKSLLLGAGHQR
jgi:hypothetical protein